MKPNVFPFSPAHPHVQYQRIFTPLLFLIFLLPLTKIAAQQITQPAQIAWGRFLDESKPGFNWAHEDLGDRIYYYGGNIYMVGRCKSDTDAFIAGGDTLHSGDGDAFVASYNPVCATYNWIRYLGSPTGLEYAYCAAIDHSGGNHWIYIAGETNETGPKTDMWDAVSYSSGGCATTFQKRPSDKKDAFIAKYDLITGNLIRWTYIGGKGMEQILSLEVDSVTHDVYFAGYTESPTFLNYAALGITPYKGDFTGLGKGMFGEFDSCLNTLKYFSYYGGNGSDRMHDLGIIYTNNTQYLVMSGTTQSSTGVVPVNGNYWDNTFGGVKDQHNPDGFLLIWNVNTLSSAPNWSSYVGGTSIDRGRGIDITSNNDIYMVAQTLCVPDTGAGAKFVPTPDACRKLPSTRYDSWLAKFHIDSFNAPLGVHLELLTYIGGGKDDFAKSVRVFHSNESCLNNDTVVISGLTYSNDLMSTDSAAYFLSGPINGNGKEKKRDAFIAVLTKDPLNPSAKQKMSSFAYLGGEKDETDIKADSTLVQKSYNPGLALGPNGSVFILYTTLGTKNKADGNIPTEYSAYHSNPDTNGKPQPDAYFAQVYPFPQHFIPETCSVSSGFKQGIQEQNEVSFYPVPFSDVTTLQVFSDQQTDAQIFIYDVFGKLILKKKLTLQGGDNNIPFDFSGYASGIYMSRMIFAGKEYEIKITKE